MCLYIVTKEIRAVTTQNIRNLTLWNFTQLCFTVKSYVAPSPCSNCVLVTIKSQYPKYCLNATWRVLVRLYFSAIELISPLKKTICWRIFFPNIDGIKSTSLWNDTKKDNINSSVQFSRSVVYNSLRPHGLQHTRPPCLSPTPRVYSNSCPSSRWCHPAISSSVVPFSPLQSFPASGSFQMSQFFESGGQSIGVSAPINKDWAFPAIIPSCVLKNSHLLPKGGKIRRKCLSKLKIS